MLLEPGALIGAKYRVTRTLGEGGMGLVYEARHEALGTSVAIKVLRDEVMKDKEAVARFAREARAAAVLRGPHAARILDVGEADGGRPFMVMELLDGNDLNDELERRGTLPITEAVDYVAQACDAIAEAHQLGIVHRDLKPANLFLSRSGRGGARVVKVLDFGISRFDVASEMRVTQTQTAFGTPLYMAPEAMRSAKYTDARSDVWAFGVILYELVTGLPPFIADTPTGVAVAVSVEKPKPLASTRADAPAELEMIIFKALEKDPERRYQDARELGDALHRFLGGERASQPPPSMETPEEGLAAPRPAAAQSQILEAATRTGEPLAKDAPPATKSRVALVLGAALAMCGLTVGLVLAFGPKKSAVTPAEVSTAEAATAAPTSESRAEPPVSPVSPVDVAPTSAPATASASAGPTPSVASPSPSARPTASSTAAAPPTPSAKPGAVPLPTGIPTATAVPAPTPKVGPGGAPLTL